MSIAVEKKDSCLYLNDKYTIFEELEYNGEINYINALSCSSKPLRTEKQIRKEFTKLFIRLNSGNSQAFESFVRSNSGSIPNKLITKCIECALDRNMKEAINMAVICGVKINILTAFKCLIADCMDTCVFYENLIDNTSYNALNVKVICKDKKNTDNKFRKTLVAGIEDDIVIYNMIYESIDD